MTHRQRWVLVLTSIASLMVALDVTVVSTALSTIRMHLDASVDQLEWTVNAYGLSFAVLLMTGAALGDRFGRRRLFAARAAAVRRGVGRVRACHQRRLADRGARRAGGRGGGDRAAVAGAAERRVRDRSGAHGRWACSAAITGPGSRRGSGLGGAVTEALAWQWIFWLNVPIGLAAIPLVRGADRGELRTAGGLDAPGLILVTVAALGIVWGLVRGNSAGWGSAEVRRHARGRGRCVGCVRARGSCARESRCCRCGCSALRRLQRATRQRC